TPTSTWPGRPRRPGSSGRRPPSGSRPSIPRSWWPATRNPTRPTRRASRPRRPPTCVTSTAWRPRPTRRRSSTTRCSAATRAAPTPAPCGAAPRPPSPDRRRLTALVVLAQAADRGAEVGLDAVGPLQAVVEQQLGERPVLRAAGGGEVCLEPGRELLVVR